MANEVTKKLRNNKTLNIVMQLSLTVPKLKIQIIFFWYLFTKYLQLPQHISGQEELSFYSTFPCSHPD